MKGSVKMKTERHLLDVGGEEEGIVKDDFKGSVLHRWVGNLAQKTRKGAGLNRNT